MLIIKCDYFPTKKIKLMISKKKTITNNPIVNRISYDRKIYFQFEST